MYNNYVSLGWFCGTASSMIKYKLRSSSGPFDWYFTELKGVLHYLENDFEGFLSDDVITLNPDKLPEFADSKYGFWYCHEISEDYFEEIDKVREKYRKRIERFRNMVKDGGVCFLRAVKNQIELEYINKNNDYINSVVKQNNKTNDIIFLIPDDYSIPPDFKQKYFLLHTIYEKDSAVALMSMFDSNKEFVKFCCDNLSKKIYLENSWPCINKELKDLYKEYNITRERYDLLLKLIRFDFSAVTLPKSVIIYGAGNIGKTLYDMISDYTSVKCFVDKNVQDTSYKNVQIVSVNMLDDIYDNEEIIVTPTYDFENIQRYLINNTKRCDKIISINDVIIGELNID